MQQSPTEPVAAPRDLFSDYRSAEGVFDESHTHEGELRPHYDPLRRSLAHLSAEELKRRSDTCRRLVDEQGITYNIYGDPRGSERPWQLDPLPFVIGAKEWTTSKQR